MCSRKTYLVSKPLRPKPHQVFFSLTDEAILKARKGVTAVPIFIVEPGPVEFHHLTLDLAKDETEQPSLPSNAPGILVRPAANGVIDVVVAACRIRNAHGDEIRLAGKNPPERERRSDRVIVRDTVVEDCGVWGLGLVRVGNARVESSRFERCRNGIKAHDCDDVVVHGVTANDNGRHGIVFTFSQRWHVDNCVAVGNGGPREGFDTDWGWGITADGELFEGLSKPNNVFTITNSFCEGNATGGITLDPTVLQVPGDPEVIECQRARVSGNVCRSARHHHGINLQHARDVVVTDNVCADNPGSGVQILNSSHVLVQANPCYGNRNGIGLFGRVVGSGHHVIGVNLLYDNTDFDIRHGDQDALTDVRIHGLHGGLEPEGNVQAEPGTLYEWHDGDDGALFVKQSGSGKTGWLRLGGT